MLKSVWFLNVLRRDLREIFWLQITSLIKSHLLIQLTTVYMVRFNSILEGVSMFQCKKYEISNPSSVLYETYFIGNNNFY